MLLGAAVNLAVSAELLYVVGNQALLLLLTCVFALTRDTKDSVLLQIILRYFINVCHKSLLSLWLSGLIHCLSHSTCWALLADGLGSNPGRSVSFQLIGLMAGIL